MKVKKVYPKNIKDLLPRRTKRSNKTSAGRCLIIAGSKGMYGAAILAASASARVGAGYTILMTDLNSKLALPPDFLTADYKKQNIRNLKFNAAAIGPGLGVTKQTEKLIKTLIALKIKNVVLDADALTVTARRKLYPLPASWVATPHEGELARFFKLSKNREQNVKKAFKLLGCNILLKGYRTLLCDGHSIFQIQAGNAALAKAGTGDVLSGMIAGFMAQGLSSINAAIVAAIIHGKIADDWVKNKDQISLVASDLLKDIPFVLKKIRKD